MLIYNKMIAKKSLILFFIIILFLFPILKYFSINSSIFDLGVFQYQISNLSIYGLGFVHFQPFQVLYSLIYLEYFLIISQVFFVLLSIYYIIKLDNKNVTLYVFVFLLSYFVWYNILFDFHYDHLSILFMFMFFYFIKEKKYKSALFISVLVSLIKEPFALVTSFMGLYMIVKSKQYLKGSLLFIYGLIYFYIVTNYVIPFFTPEYVIVGNESNALFGNGGSLFDIALYPITHFKEFVIDIIATKKIIYLLALFTAFGIVVVFFSPLELIPAIPPLAIAMLSNIENYYWYNTHYTAPLVAPFMVAFIYGFPRFVQFCNQYIKYLDTQKKVITVVFIPIILSHVIFSPSPLSRFFWINKLPQYHYSVYIPSQRNKIIKEAILKYIPKDKNISVSSQNSLNLGYLAQKKYYFAFPQGAIIDADVLYIDDINFINLMKYLIKQDNSIVKSKKEKADYVTIDFNKPLYLMDKNVNKEKFMKVVDKMKKDYGLVYEYNGFYIYKKI